MAGSMDTTAQVEQRLSMSLDDLIKSNKKDASKPRGGRPMKKAGDGRGRSRLGAKPAAVNEDGVPEAEAKPKAAGRRRGAKAKETLGVRTKALKNAPKQTGGRSANTVKKVAEAVGAAVKNAFAKVTGGGGGKARGGRGSKAAPRGRGSAASAPSNGRARTKAKVPPAAGGGGGGGVQGKAPSGRGGGSRGGGRGGARGGGGAKTQNLTKLSIAPTAMKVTFSNKQHAGGATARRGSHSGREANRSSAARGQRRNTHGVTIPQGW